MTLSDNEMNILAFAELQAGLPLTEISKQIGLKEPTVRRTIQRLTEQGVIANKRTYVNTYLLGYTNFVIYFSLTPEAQPNRQKIVDEILTAPMIGWFAEIGGRFQYAASVTCRHVNQVMEFISEMSGRFDNPFADKTVSVRSAVYTYPRAYLAAKAASVPPLAWGGTDIGLELDETDKKIIHSLAISDVISNRDHARQLDIPPSTFERRVQKLEELKVIDGYIYKLDMSKVGIQQMRILLTAKGMNPSLQAALADFARKHPNVRKLVECLGSWDCEFEINLLEGQQVSAITDDIYSSFKDSVANLETIPLFRHKTSAPFRFLD